jgi:hypothetical protein
MGDDEGRFDRPRVYAASALIATTCLLVLLDALSVEYTASDVTVGILLGIGATLLGVEISDLARRR